MDSRREVEEITHTFLEAMNLSLTPTVTETEDRIQIDLSGPDAYLLLERKGSVMEALQLLLGKVAESRVGLSKRIVLDCEGYRGGRDSELAELAIRIAQQVRTSRQAVEMEPLNSYERRIVHLTLADEPGVSSHSEGDGFHKRIIVSPS